MSVVIREEFEKDDDLQFLIYFNSSNMYREYISKMRVT